MKRRRADEELEEALTLGPARSIPPVEDTADTHRNPLMELPPYLAKNRPAYAYGTLPEWPKATIPRKRFREESAKEIGGRP